MTSEERYKILRKMGFRDQMFGAYKVYPPHGTLCVYGSGEFQVLCTEKNYDLIHADILALREKGVIEPAPITE